MTSKERLPFRWERDTHSGKWRLTTYDMGDELVAGYDHVAGHYEGCLIDEIERLTRERDETQERFEELRDVVYNTANVERDRLRAALVKYGHHTHPNCHDLTLNDDGSFGPRNGCLCGFESETCARSEP